MKKEENIVSYTANELKTMRQKGKSRTDWGKVLENEDIETITKVRKSLPKSKNQVKNFNKTENK